MWQNKQAYIRYSLRSPPRRELTARIDIGAPWISYMSWDLRGSLLKKEERESARLADFEFKLRARTFRLLAETLAVPPSEIVGLIATGGDTLVLRKVAARFPDRVTDLEASYARCRSTARTQLIAQEGDPSPFRLA